MNEKHPLSAGTRVEYHIEDGFPDATGAGVVLQSEYDDGWLYHIGVPEGSVGAERCDEHGHVLAWDFEVRRLPTDTGADPGVASST